MFNNNDSTQHSTGLILQEDHKAPAESGGLAEEQDGRSKEYQDRARINPNPDPDALTNYERDFEPETLPRKSDDKEKPAY